MKNIKVLRIDTTDVILQDYEIGEGKIIISDDDYGYNFSCYWGAMGENSTLKEFLCRINSSYFVDKLSSRTKGDFDAKITFRNIRKFIREECGLPWYKEMAFQKDFREKLKDWERDCNSEHEFVNDWDNFMKYTLEYYLIEDKYERESIENTLTGIGEPWNFISYQEPRENIWLEKFHEKLKKFLSN